MTSRNQIHRWSSGLCQSLRWNCPSSCTDPDLTSLINLRPKENKTSPLGVQLGTARVHIRGAGVLVGSRQQHRSKGSLCLNTFSPCRFPELAKFRAPVLFLVFPQYNLSFTDKSPASDFWLDPMEKS